MTTRPRHSLGQDAPAFLCGLVDTLGSDVDADEFLSTFVTRSRVILGMDSATLLLTDGDGTLEIAEYDGELARTLSLLEVSGGDGPSIESYRTSLARWYPVIPALTQRWPDLAAAARAAGITALLVVPMQRRGKAIGVLTLLDDRDIEFDIDTIQLAGSLAEAATIGLLNARTMRRHEHTAAQLQTALASRIVIEQAKGILAERLGVTVDEAFRQLRGHARARNLNLRTLAQDIVEGHVQIIRD